mmetsp:Transcript_1904/g.2602  ORF Transcript_1904/g.2602 Transcript_1904/m.2602 type:complete len:81 (+) Transcript_1904:6-248(+)
MCEFFSTRFQSVFLESTVSKEANTIISQDLSCCFLLFFSIAVKEINSYHHQIYNSAYFLSGSNLHKGGGGGGWKKQQITL